jgi:hypothetical protein
MSKSLYQCHGSLSKRAECDRLLWRLWNLRSIRNLPPTQGTSRGECCRVLTIDSGAGPVIFITLHNQTHTNYESYSSCPVDLTLDENTTVRGTLGQISRGMAPATLSLAYSDYVHDLPIVRDLWSTGVGILGRPCLPPTLPIRISDEFSWLGTVHWIQSIGRPTCNANSRNLLVWWLAERRTISMLRSSLRLFGSCCPLLWADTTHCIDWSHACSGAALLDRTIVAANHEQEQCHLDTFSSNLSCRWTIIFALGYLHWRLYNNLLLSYLSRSGCWLFNQPFDPCAIGYSAVSCTMRRGSRVLFRLLNSQHKQRPKLATVKHLISRYN